MRSTRFALLSGFILSLVATSAIARGPLTVEQEVSDIDEVKNVMEKEIPDYLKASQCGGWNTELSVEGKIANVSGVPGRKGEWDAAKMSGMALREDTDGDENRDNDYFYPDSATGLTTACAQNTDQITKTVWRYVLGGRDKEVHQVEVTFDHPKFGDPACRWRIKKEDKFLEVAPDVPLVDNNPLTGNKYQYEEYDEDYLNRQSPETCQGLCTYLNTFQYLDCVEPTWEFDFDTLQFYRACPEPRPSDETQTKPNMTLFFLCTGKPVDGNAESCSPGTPPTETPNSRTCQGQACRCPGPECPSLQLEGEENIAYDSYYRRYAGSYEREPVPLKDEKGKDKKEVASKDADVACYGFYNEFDPRYKQTEEKDYRCVINMDVADMRESQKGKWAYDQMSKPKSSSGISSSSRPSSWPDPDPTKKVNQRKNGEFDEEEDLWFERLGRSFSLLNEKVFDEDFDKDLAAVFLDIENIDRGDQKAAYQLDEKNPLAKSSDIRAFDDTGEERTLASWWQKQEQEMAELMHQRVVRLLLPTGWSFGADPEDPLFREKKATLVIDEETRLQRIEVQIGGDEDILGTVLGYIERSLLLRVQEEPVPIIVPLGSPTEFRARAQAWCSWHMRTASSDNCDDAPDNVRKLMEQLEQYADEIERVRELRAELANFAGEILGLQKELTTPISTWVSQNIDAYQAILDDALSVRTLTDGIWREIQLMMNDLHDDANQPWCMNQRYTTPVYSLLDQWMESREEEGKISADGLPNLTIERPDDIIIDLSTITYMTGSIVLPVLNPIQIRITDVPSPPDTASIVELPPLPDIDEIQARIRQKVNSLPKPPSDVPVPEPIDFKPLGKERIGQITETLIEMQPLVTDISDSYREFWGSLAPLKPDDDSKERNEIPEMKRHLECMSWDTQPCKHVEMDLLERFTRIGSRPLVQLTEDYDAFGTPRMFGGACLPGEDNCVPSHPESTPVRHQWDIIGPETQEEFMDDLRESVRSLTLPEPVGNVDPDDLPQYDTDLNNLLPVHDVPDAIDLTPPQEPSSAPPDA